MNKMESKNLLHGVLFIYKQWTQRYIKQMIVMLKIQTSLSRETEYSLWITSSLNPSSGIKYYWIQFNLIS